MHSLSPAILLFLQELYCRITSEIASTWSGPLNVWVINRDMYMYFFQNLGRGKVIKIYGDSGQ